MVKYFRNLDEDKSRMRSDCGQENFSPSANNYENCLNQAKADSGRPNIAYFLCLYAPGINVLHHHPFRRAKTVYKRQPWSNHGGKALPGISRSDATRRCKKLEIATMTSGGVLEQTRSQLGGDGRSRMQITPIGLGSYGKPVTTVRTRAVGREAEHQGASHGGSRQV